MKAVVTGGGGFLGQAVVEQLLDRGWSVTVVGRGTYPQVEARGACTLRLDVADDDQDPLTRALDGSELCVHAAAKAGVWGPRAEYERINVRGTENVLAACRATGVPRLVYTSSPSVVFDGHDHRNAGPDLPYAAHYEALYPETKARAERAVLAANSATLATVALRPHLIWGPRDPHLLPRLIRRAVTGRLVQVGDGTNEVSITYVENAAAAHVQAAAKLAPGVPWSGRAFFVNDPEPVRLWSWLTELMHGLGLPGPKRHVSLGLARFVGGIAESVWSALALSGEPPVTRFVASQLATSHTYDLGPAREAFGYAPPVPAAEALATTVAWWKTRLSEVG